MIVYLFGCAFMIPNATAAALSPFPQMAGAASSLLGAMPFGLGALVSALLAAAFDGTTRPDGARDRSVRGSGFSLREVLLQENIMDARMDRVECVVVGAGVVGLAVARALALAGREVVILEAEDAIGTHTSSRNSEVIHAGIYYPKGSLKARSCVHGRKLLYEYCASARRAAPALRETDRRHLGRAGGRTAMRSSRKAHENGVTDVVEISAGEAMRMEPALHCVAALHSPSTGIIDSHALMLAYLGDAEAAGAMLASEEFARKVVFTGRGF